MKFKLPFNPRNRKTQVLVGTFIVLLLGSAAFCSQKAEASEARAEAGVAVVRGETPVFGVSGFFEDAGPGLLDLEVGVELIAESTYDGIEQSNTATVYGMAWVNAGPRVQLGLGLAHTQGTQTFTCENTFALGVRWKFSQRYSAQWRHFSSADTCKPNSGRDTITVSAALGKLEPRGDLFSGMRD